MLDETNESGSTTQANADTGETTQAAETKEAASTGGLPGGDESTETNSDNGLPGGDVKAGEKAGDDKSKDGSDADDDAGEKPTGAPEKYDEFDLSAGKDIDYSMSDEQKTAFTDFGKANNLSNEQMANVLNFDIANRQNQAAANNKLIADLKEDGIKGSRKEHGEKYNEKHAKNANVYNKFFSEEMRTKLNDYGISSEPGFFNALNAISSVLSEDVMVAPDRASNDKSKRTLAEACAPT